MNKLLENKKNNELSIGTFNMMKDIMSLQLAGVCGLDFSIIDTEHAAFGPEWVANAISACAAVGTAPLVRVNGIQRAGILHALDAGAAGLIIPAVETVDQVKELIEYAKYPPIGNRGYFSSFDKDFGELEVRLGGLRQFMDYANGNTLLLPQCETVGAVEHLEEIVALDGVAGVFVGPYDLSIAIGHPGELSHPEQLEILRRVQRVCEKHGKLSLIFCGTAETANAMAEMGYDAVAVSTDTMILRSAWKGIVREIRGPEAE